jgi:NAD(P)-dependent dehydrogenase (short-subunit alcohol dehydrogenase family)
MLLEGKVAIVSGIGPGMGRDIALALAREGADVAMGARREKGLVKVSGEVEALGRRAVWTRTDITDPEQCAALAQLAKDELGRVDILVNNAFSDGTFTLFEEGNLDGWRQTMEVNLFGTLQMTGAVLPFLREQEDSRVIMVNSQSAQIVQERFGAYAASKGALAVATQSLARELGRYGVRVNGIFPSYIWGPSVEWYVNDMAEKRGVPFETVYQELADETCLKYLPHSSEIAGAVVFFASPLAKAVTGQSLNVNCGEYLS